VNDRDITISDYYESKSLFIKRDEFNQNFVKKCENDDTYTVNNETQVLEKKNISYVMKHRVKKRMFKIIVGEKTAVCTEDHSLIVVRHDKLIEIKPRDVRNGDKLVRLKR
jgi:hypothetical protein